MYAASLCSAMGTGSWCVGVSQTGGFQAPHTCGFFFDSNWLVCRAGCHSFWYLSLKRGFARGRPLYIRPSLPAFQSADKTSGVLQ